MPGPSPPLTANELLSKTMGSELEAQFAQFIQLWHSSESLRSLIRQVAYASSENSPKPEREIESSRRGNSTPSSSPDGGLTIADLIDKYPLYANRIAERLSQSFGGLSRKELLILLDRHKSGNRNLAVYLLVRAWKKRIETKTSDIRLCQLTTDATRLAIQQNRSDFFHEVADTIEFFGQAGYQDNDQWNHDPGNWWQFHLLLYVLENPKEKYPIREFVKHFREEVGTNEMPTTKTIRRFCRSHGIALDSTPGAPRKAETE